MAKTSVTNRNNRRKLLVAHHKQRRQEYKLKAYDSSLSLEERLYWQQKLQSLPRDSSSTRLRKRCMLTSRGRGIVGKFMLSRIKFRELAVLGKIPGVVRSSW